MKLIPNDEIFGKICTLISTAKKEVIIVSPYNDLKGWNKLINTIKKAQKNNVKIYWYTRGNHVKEINAEHVRSLDIEPILVDHLHAKMYINEKIAVVTSMNLSQVSYSQSIEIGYLADNQTERDEIYDYYVNNIKNSSDIGKEESVTYLILQDKKVVPKLDSSLNKISDLFYVKGIFEHIIEKYGNYDFKYNIEGDHENPNNGRLKSFCLKKAGYRIEFWPFDISVNAIKLYIYLPKTLTGYIIPYKSLDSIKKKLTFGSELIYDEEENFIKYYYVSNVKIATWDKKKLDIYLHDLDLVLGLVFQMK